MPGTINIVKAAFDKCPSNDATGILQSYAQGRTFLGLQANAEYFPGICADSSAILSVTYFCTPLSSGKYKIFNKTMSIMLS